jgi:hypothetical protein
LNTQQGGGKPNSAARKGNRHGEEQKPAGRRRRIQTHKIGSDSGWLSPDWIDFFKLRTPAAHLAFE